MTEPTAFSAILVAAGRSSRMGVDKLWVDLWGRPAWRWSLDALLETPGMERVVVAVPADAKERFADALPADVGARCTIVLGGADRAGSVIAGLWALVERGASDETLVLVHDAARPAVTPALVERVATAAQVGDVAVIPVVPVVDSLKRVRNDRVVGPVDRDELAAAQTPQAARLEALRSAIEEARAWGRPIPDDAAALAAAGTPVLTVPGDASNRKLTQPDDVDLLRRTLASRASPISATTGGRMGECRSGIGFDAHRLVPGRPMWIGGVQIPDEPLGPEGHSDGDAVLHALVDAMLGAAGLGDIGVLAPSDDSRWAGVASTDLVMYAVERLAEHGWQPLSADVAVAVARPPIAPRRGEIAGAIAGAMGVERRNVSVKGTTTDGLGMVGAGGIAAWAVATVGRPG
jgi:2-C-methyl-D-erythritol 4-phosphate cytidylyltransferase/2-C-methyl-D-erythritol 2,4-cyclodiphosphate synthase